MSDEAKLLPHRDAIDQIDQQVLQLLNQRAQHARAIGELKGTGVVYRPEREAQVLRRIQDLNEGPLPNEAVARLFREIMSECLAIERPLTIAYLGPEGTFTQLAAMKHFGHAAHSVACATVDDSLRLVDSASSRLCGRTCRKFHRRLGWTHVGFAGVHAITRLWRSGIANSSSLVAPNG